MYDHLEKVTEIQRLADGVSSDTKLQRGTRKNFRVLKIFVT